jgi:hypothetical protein
MFFRVVACVLLLGITFHGHGQEAFNDALLPLNENSSASSSKGEPTVEIPTYQSEPEVGSPADQGAQAFEVQSKSKAAPLESAWLDLRQNASANSTVQSAPDWVEAVTMIPVEENGQRSKTVFHLQLGHPSADYSILFFRLLFDDKAERRPELIARDESGAQVLRSGKLGAEIDLASSDSAMIPMNGISSIDVEVPGDGKTVRGAYLDWMTSSDVVHPLSMEHRDMIAAPFSAMPPLHSPTQDKEQFGTVTATLATDTIHIGSEIQDAAVFRFGIETQPLLALLTFEVASSRIDAPPEVYVNGQAIGPVSFSLPELADPAYRGETQSLVRQMQFRYTGWLRAQKIVPIGSLKVGTNDLIVRNGSGGGNSAIRATQIQLKYLWDKFDYVLQPGH